VTLRAGLIVLLVAVVALALLATALTVALARAYRSMRMYAVAVAAHREQARGNLEALGTTLSSTHDLPAMLPVVLASAMAATGAARGIVLLSEHDPETVGPSGPRSVPVPMVVGCSAGFDTEPIGEMSSLQVAPDVGLLGAVVASGAAQRGRIPQGSTGFAPGEPQCATYLAVPLAAAGVSEPEVAVGVLALYDRAGGREFDDTDLQTVQTLAGQAAVAVANVRRHDEAQRLSRMDPLTGLYNYRHLQECLEREVLRAARRKHELCVIAIDLDRFKDVNDTYGHAAGDAVLAEFARRVAAEIRGDDVAFRTGGEEFVVLLPETTASGGEALARRLGSVIRDAPITVADVLRATGDLVTVEIPLVTTADEASRSPSGRNRASASVPHHHRAGVHLTASMGVAVYPAHGDSVADILVAADAALYAAKAAGRDTYRLAAPPSAVLEPRDRAAVPAQHEAVSDGTGEQAAGLVAGGASPAGPPPRQPSAR
jgi:two-component system, cell cycle response regulator